MLSPFKFGKILSYASPGISEEFRKQPKSFDLIICELSHLERDNVSFLKSIFHR